MTSVVSGRRVVVKTVLDGCIIISDPDPGGQMSRRLKAMLIAVMLTLAAGCHGSCRHAPGPAFIDRRPPAVADIAFRPGMDPDDMEPLSPRRRTHPLVGRLHGEGSLSIGTATRGFLVAGRELPTAGTFHRVMKEQAGRATNFGTD